MVACKTMRKKEKENKNKTAKRGGMKNKTAKRGGMVKKEKKEKKVGKTVKKVDKTLKKGGRSAVGKAKQRTQKVKRSRNMREKRKHKIKRRKTDMGMGLLYGGNNDLYDKLKSVILRQYQDIKNDEIRNNQANWSWVMSRVLRELDDADDLKEALMVRDENGNTLVHLAAKQPIPDGVRLLDAEFGSDPAADILEPLIDIDRIVGRNWVNNNVVNVKNNAGNTPLHSAVEGVNPFTYDILVEYGADPAIRNNARKTPIQYAIERGVPEDFYYPLDDEERLSELDIDNLRESGIQLRDPEEMFD